MKKTTIIVPCAGKSSRFPGLRPKYLLVNPNGNLMAMDAISKINLRGCDLIFTVLKEHEEKYQLNKVLKKLFKKQAVKLCILKRPTQSQSETVYNTLKKMRVTTPFLIKDSDSIFRLEEVAEKFNYVTVEKLDNLKSVNPSNKSYVLYDSSGIIINIEEKKIISNTFSVGGYYFTDPDDFMDAFGELSKSKSIGEKNELYISAIINYLIFNKKMKFKIKNVSDYLDSGTINEWLAYKNEIKTYFIDIDGIIVKNSGEYFKPYWGTTDGIEENINLIKDLYDRGNQIILVTSRREKYRKITIEQIKRLNLKYHRLIMGLFHSQRVLVNDFSNSNPYPSATAVNIPRDADELSRYLQFSKPR